MRASLLGAVLGLFIYRLSGVASNFPVLCYYEHNRDAPPTRPESTMNDLANKLNRGTHYQAGKWICTMPMCGHSQILERQVNGELHVLHHNLPFQSALQSIYQRHMDYCKAHG